MVYTSVRHFVPVCVVLTDAQYEKFLEFRKECGPLPRNHEEEDCAPSSRFIFSSQDTSIGFLLWVQDEVTGKKISLLTQEDIDNA